MTAEWIMDNPKKAVKIMRLISDSRWYINEEKNVYPAYEKLTGETEDMSESTEDSPPNNLQCILGKYHDHGFTYKFLILKGEIVLWQQEWKELELKDV